ncbi:MAG TPA: PP2C family protein-serine/threonine phosphatase [Thermoanaerobaculia bacterium]|nr:PP2C family protein-serine/threonine phosphatase [Thermoanaerobaculia bacterium]
MSSHHSHTGTGPAIRHKDPSAHDYRRLMKKVEHFVEAIESADDLSTRIHQAAGAIVKAFRDELGLTGGRLYQRAGADYELKATFPEAKPLASLRVPRTYRPIERVLEEGALYMEADDPALDRQLEELIGARQFAVVEVADEEYLLAFDVAQGADHETVVFSLGILRHAINQKIALERVAGMYDQARRIQTSILPRRAPAYGNYDIAGRSEPMENVGGDFYDFISITDKILGVAIADVSGHGLPAALQVRDIYTGLRMGMARDFKIVRTVERLNHIIHGSTLTSRFVSMFYGELELHGLFIYVNAGHPPPFRLRAADGGYDLLERGGAVLGPLPDASYERGFVTLAPGDVIVLYTDGIVETLGAEPGGPEQEFGLERLVACVREAKSRPAGDIVRAVFAGVESFAGDRPVADDRTVVVVRYPADSP